MKEILIVCLPNNNELGKLLVENETEFINQDPLQGLGDGVEKTKTLDEVIFADPIKYIDNGCNIESEHYQQKHNIEGKRNGKRKKYDIDIEDGSSLVCPEAVCNRKFSTATLLKAHVRKVHRAARRYVCEVCGSGFKARYLLTRHMSVHEGRKVQCPVCQRQLSERTSLSAHMRFVHRQGELRCDKCDLRFERRNQYVRHRASHKT